MNNLTLVGNLTRDFELRFGDGWAVANSAIAVNKSWFNKKTNEWDEKTTFFNISVWGESETSNVVESLSKGDRVIVAGEMQVGSYEDDNGDKRVTAEVRVSEIGPALRWASASITRNPKKDSGSSYSTPEEKF
jgi:single-strand DNA-binding protein